MAKRSRTPSCLCSGGVIWSGATAALTCLVDALGAPVAATCNGKGALPDNHPLALSYVSFAFVI